MTRVAKLHFLDLPPELLTQIILELDWKDFLRLQLVCKATLDLTNTSEIQYRICLGALGYEATLAKPKYPTIDQLGKFQKLSKNFLTGHFTKKESVPIKGFTPTYELQGGAFIQGRHAPNNPRDTVGVNVFKFASFLNDEPTTQWQLPNFARVVRDLTLDPSQDLLALIVDKTPSNHYTRPVIDLEFYSLETGQIHPMVKGNVPQETWHINGFIVLGFIITIMEDFVGLLTVNNQFFVCNWKTGQIHAVDNFPPENKIHDFFFLDHSRYALVRGDFNPPEVHIHALHTESADPSKSMLLAIYHLPRLQDDVILRLQCRSDPVPLCRNPTVDTSPIHVRPEERVLIFTFSMQTAQFLGTFLLCVRAESFMNAPPDAQQDENGVLLVTSNLWMSQTRLLPDWIGDHNWMCYCYGSRFITFAYTQPDTGERTCQIFLLEFNPTLIKLASSKVGWNSTLLGEYDASEDDWSFVIGTSSRDPDPFLAEQWTSALPVMRIVTSIKYELAPEDQLVVMLDQERIIAILLKTDDTHMREPYMLDIHHPRD
ncbi:hypothetical protein CPB86DRAFT_778193 [Serendipita vermifera]|nr:hypothetical protein CPB86DRAFT_778193 [Serendipita vermifera]